MRNNPGIVPEAWVWIDLHIRVRFYWKARPDDANGVTRR